MAHLASRLHMSTPTDNGGGRLFQAALPMTEVRQLKSFRRTNGCDMHKCRSYKASAGWSVASGCAQRRNNSDTRSASMGTAWWEDETAHELRPVLRCQLLALISKQTRLTRKAKQLRLAGVKTGSRTPLSPLLASAASHLRTFATRPRRGPSPRYYPTSENR